MSDCDIRTGVWAGGSVNRAGNSPLIPTPGKSVLFNEFSDPTNKFSPWFYVDVGQTVLLDAYNLKPDVHIFVNRLLISNVPPQRGCNCNENDMRNALGRDGVVTHSERMTLGPDNLLWSIYNPSDPACANERRMQLMLSIPGIYNLEIEDITDVIGDLRVEYAIWRTKEVPDLPAEYHAGIGYACERREEETA